MGIAVHYRPIPATIECERATSAVGGAAPPLLSAADVLSILPPEGSDGPPTACSSADDPTAAMAAPGRRSHALVPPPRSLLVLLVLTACQPLSAAPSAQSSGEHAAKHRATTSPAPEPRRRGAQATQTGPAAPTPVPVPNVTEYQDPLFRPYDPNRHYVHVRYFEVGKVDFEHVRAPFVIGCWILIAGLAKMAFHSVPQLSGMVPESCLLIGLGIGVGAFLYACLGDIEASHHLDPDTFFLYMLPPIILDAGYFMPNRLFFDNLGTILLLAVAGTIFNTFAIAGGLYVVGLSGVYGVETSLLDIFIFSALISAVDPVAVLAVFEEIQVNEVLYILVFGESLLNDAVTVGLYHMFEEYMILGHSAFRMTDIGKGFVKFASAAIGGTVIGIVWGFLTAFLTRFTHKAHVMEPIFVFTMPFLAYLNAEMFHLSGILSITFCGLTMKNYVITNVSAKSHTTIKYMMKMLASCSETAIFMLLGVATVHNHHDFNLAFVLATIAFCIIVRSIGVVILTTFANRLRLRPIAVVDVFVLAYGGLRGAVAFALVMLIDPHYVKEQQMFLTTTISVVYFTVFFQGMSIKPLVKRLGVERASKRKLTMNERIHERALDYLKAGVETIVGHPFSYNVRQRFKQINHSYLLPCLTRGNHTRARDPKIMETFSNLVMVDAMQNFNDIANVGGQSSQQLNLSSTTASVSDLPSSPPPTTSCPATPTSPTPPPSLPPRRFSYKRHVTRDEPLPNPVLTALDQLQITQDMDARQLLRASLQSNAGQRRGAAAVPRGAGRRHSLSLGRRRLGSEPGRGKQMDQTEAVRRGSGGVTAGRNGSILQYTRL